MQTVTYRMDKQQGPNCFILCQGTSQCPVINDNGKEYEEKNINRTAKITAIQEMNTSQN